MSAHLPLYSGVSQQCPLPVPLTPLPTPCTITTDNSLELHIPVPIPTPPTPLPIVIAYPLSQSPALPVLVERSLFGPPMATGPSMSHGSDVYPHSPSYAGQYAPPQLCTSFERTGSGYTDDSGLELDPVPFRNSGGPVIPVFRSENEATLAAQDLGFELVDISPEELEKMNFDKLAANGLEERTLNLFRALNLPINIHKLRAMRAAGKIPVPLLKLKYYKSGLKTIARPGSCKTSGFDEPAEMETIQGESWYLPSAEARRIKRHMQEGRGTQRESEDRDQYTDSGFRHVFYQPHQQHQPHQYSQHQRTFGNTDRPTPEQTLLDQFPLPPPSLMIPPQSPAYAHFRTHGIAPALSSTPTPSKASSTSRPLGYMYAPPTPKNVRTPSCKSCGSLPSPQSSIRHSPSPLSVPANTNTNMTTNPVNVRNFSSGTAGSVTFCNMLPPEITIDPAPSPYTAAAAALHYSPKQLPSPQPSLRNELGVKGMGRSLSITR